MASKDAANSVTEDLVKGQDSGVTDTGQSIQSEETSNRTKQVEKENDLQQADNLSANQIELNIPLSPEALAVRPHGDYNLVNSLLNLTKSPVSVLFIIAELILD